MAEIQYVRPQPGYQMKALSSSADIVIGGSAAGVGKTFSLLLDFIRHIDNKDWGGVIFRRTSPQIRNEGGLWDTSMDLYTRLHATPKESSLEWVFKSGAGLKFSHLEYEKNVFDWQGAQIPFIGFDELTHFSEKMFFYLLSRNRSMCGIKPVVRATCNPDPESWVSKLVSWWIDEKTGFPIAERDGVVRYFIKYGDDYIWGDSLGEVHEKAYHILEPLMEKSGLPVGSFIKSITFVSGSIYDNKELIKANPEYLANLLSQDEQTRKQLLDGNWKVVVSDLDVYDYYKFIGVFDNLMEVEKAGKYITADIALKGSNKLVVGYWEGFELMNIEIMEKSDGKDVIDLISSVAKYYGVQNSNICYDSDGVGGYVDGYIKGAIPFNGGVPAIEVKDKASGKKIKENYFNLKTQCFYRSGARVDRGEYKVNEMVASKMYDTKMTVRQRFLHERKAIKRASVDSDGKLKIISKEEMKTKLNGESPDLMDMWMMREIFELKTKRTWVSA